MALLEWINDDEVRAAAPPTWIIIHFMLWGLSALFIVPATLRADLAVMQRAPPLWAYLRGMMSAVLSALSITALFACLALGYGRFWAHPQSLPSAALVARYVKTLMDLCFAGGLVLLCRINHYQARRIAINIQNAEDRRTTLERRLTDSRLAIAEARMDPTALLQALADIRHDLAHSASGGDGKLDELIAKLRRATADTMRAAESETIYP